MIDSSLQRSDILKINDEEVIVVADLYDWKGESEADICRKLLKLYNLKLVILTRGTNGSYVFSR